MSYNTIKIKNYLDVFEEYEAYEAISPGMLIEPRPGYETVRKHATEGGNAIPMFAIENFLEGKGITDAYAAGEKVQCWIPQRGDQVYALIEDEQNIAIGDYLESNGSGYLQKHIPDEGSAAVYPNQIIGQALEALDLSSLSTADSSLYPKRQFCRIRIL